jgi:subtilase family serine protease
MDPLKDSFRRRLLSDMRFFPPQGDAVAEYPASLGCVYNLVSPRVPGCNFYTASVNPTGGSKAIAIVDAYDAPNALSDLQAFSTNWGLPIPSSPSTFQVVYASGTQPAYDAGWEVEESLDVQWAHAMAPNAKIYLVEAATNSASDLFTAVSVANGLVAAAGRRGSLDELGRD